jgi:hypothetical protein
MVRGGGNEVGEALVDHPLIRSEAGGMALYRRAELRPDPIPVCRIVVNAFAHPQEVSYASVHGGLFPATSDSRFTSVGLNAIERFLRPVCYQGSRRTAAGSASEWQSAGNLAADGW